MTPAQSAEKEAFEEGGVIGRAFDLCLGVYSYQKEMQNGVMIPCVGLVYPLRVKSVLTKYPESGERRRKWASRKKAAAMVQEPELKRILKSFEPAWLKGRKA